MSANLFPPGAYIFEVVKLGEPRQTKSGKPFRIFDVRLIGTDYCDHWIALDIDLERVGLTPDLVGRRFVFDVKRSPSVAHNAARLMLGQPICEVLDS